MSRNLSFWAGGALSAALHLGALWCLAHLTPPQPHFAPGDAGVITVSLRIAEPRDERALAMLPEAGMGQRQASDVAEKLGRVPDAIAKRSDPMASPKVDFYFPPEELLSHAQPVTEISLDEHCLQHGKIVLKLWISERGRVDRIEKIDSTADERCVAMAKAAFQHATFVPGRRDDKPVKCLWFVEIWNGNNL